ncbi:nucleoside triphosphate pyrophosphohydrolase family protein [Caldanaerobius polysaccharolyticus]|uniref:nucleoside triphosphate pyrophosphohydrolase family protein n=1 Tax=Caldanaerobius polysaccharolyticus TaxID=44256 RepID=UPI00047EDB1F|nr:nucleoside triphosphate pyrophosphohydrolase family protein [Caldanaerobius polysaccharolyticus]
MTLNDYQVMAMRTKPEYKDFEEQIDNACLGLVGEVGEVVDVVKKWLYQGHQLDRRKVGEELGDILWYIALMADALGITMNDIGQQNIKKLLERYPNGFETNRSVHRKEDSN